MNGRRSTPGSGLTGARLLQVSGIVALGTLLSRLTGLVRIVTTAAALGDDRVADAYNLANVAPNIVYELIIGGVLSATLVPLFVRASENEDRSGPNALASLTFGALVALAGLSTAAAPLVAQLFGATPTEAANDSFDLLTTFLHLILPEIFFYGLTALLTAALHAQRRFLAAAFAPVLNNVVVIAVMGFATSAYTSCVPAGSTDCSVETEVGTNHSAQLVVGIGTTAGIVAMTVALLWAVRRAGIGFRWRWEPRHPMASDLARLAGWTVGYVATNQVALLVILRLATGHGEGTVTAYQNAFVFFQLPHGLIAVTLMTTLLPEMSSAASDGNLRAFRRSFAFGTRTILAPMLSAVALLIVLARDITVFTLARGAFGEELATVTGSTLAALLVGLPAFSVYLFVFRGFYALENTKTPFMLNAGENGLNIVLAAFLVGSGASGLGWAYAIAYWAAVVPAVIALHRRVEFTPSEWTETAQGVARSVLLAIGVALAAWATHAVVGDSSELWSIVMTSAVAGTVFVGLGIVLRVDGFDQARAAVNDRRPSGTRRR